MNAAVVVASGPTDLTLDRQPNGEVLVSFSASKDTFYRIEASHDLNEWIPLSTVPGDDTLEYLDSEANYLPERYYRAVALED